MSKRIQVILSEELDLKLTSYSERYGISKSSIVGFVLGQWVDQMEKMNNSVYGATGKEGLIAEILKEVSNQNNNSNK
jgi:hypothetical protein